MSLIVILGLMSMTVFLAQGQTCDTSTYTVTSTISSDCGTTKNFIVAKFYLFSAKELDKTCCRESVTSTSPTVKATQLSPNAVLGKCMCKAPETPTTTLAPGTCPSDQKKAAVAECCDVWVKAPPNSFNIQHIRKSKAKQLKAGVCKGSVSDGPCCCTPEATECLNSTLNTTPAATTPAPLCPAMPTPVVTSRMLGGTTTDACLSSTVRFLLQSENTVFNGVYTYLPKLNSKQPVVVIPKGSLKMAQALEKFKITLKLSFNNQTVGFNTTTVTATNMSDGSAALTIPNLPSGCQKAACAYDSNTMSNAINKSDCYVDSYGADGFGSNTVPSFSGKLKRATISLNKACGKDGNECFESSSSSVYPCINDYGAPVICSLNTGEKVLYGMTQLMSTCNATFNKFQVSPISQ